MRIVVSIFVFLCLLLSGLSLITGTNDPVDLSGIPNKFPQARGNLSDSLVAHWDFDEGEGNVLNDRSGNGHDGAISGATWVNGIDDTGLEFNGTTDYVDCGNDNELKPQRLSVSAWVKADSYISDKARIIIDGDYNDSVRGYALFQSLDNEIGFAVRNGKDDKGMINSSTLIDTERCYHIVGTYDGTRVKIYVNGEIEGNIPYSNTITYGNNPITLGRYYVRPNQGYDFQGALDEVKIYNYALSPEEIKKEYEKLKPDEMLDTFEELYDLHIDPTNPIASSLLFSVGSCFLTNSFNSGHCCVGSESGTGHQ